MADSIGIQGMEHDPIVMLKDLVLAATLYSSMVNTTFKLFRGDDLTGDHKAEREAAIQSFLDQADKSEKFLSDLCNTVAVDLSRFDGVYGTGFAAEISALYESLYGGADQEDNGPELTEEIEDQAMIDEIEQMWAAVEAEYDAEVEHGAGTGQLPC